MAPLEIAIVIPAWNEATGIGEVVGSAACHGRVIVVDDKSTDGTGETARKAGADVIFHEYNLGYDGALESGIHHARSTGAKHIITMDADGSHDPSHIAEMVRQLEEGSCIVVGIRPFMARWSERLFGLWTVLRWGVPDPLCGMKAYRSELFDRFDRFDRYKSIGTDLLLRALRAGLPVSTLPVNCHPRNQGPSRFGSGWPAHRKILRALWIGFSTTVGHK